MKDINEKEKALERMHDEYRKEHKENEEDEWVRMQRTGGGAET
jgi:hypothetical protein